MIFLRVLDVRNDLGLLAEEYETVAGRQLGNFPQALSLSASSTHHCGEVTARANDGG